MKLERYLIFVLVAHSHTLHRLAAYFGEEDFLEILESIGEIPITPSPEPLHREWFSNPTTQDQSSAFFRLQGAVQELKLGPVLEFHLWAYPYYRFIIESSISLNSEICLTGHALEKMVESAMQEAEKWIQFLPIPPRYGKNAERIALIPWLRFRSEVLKSSGRRAISRIK
jgi:hypothetical protein